MVSQIAKQIDQLDADIRFQKLRLEKLEDDYLKQRHELDQAFFELDDLNNQMNQYYEEKYQEVTHFLSTQSNDVTESHANLNQLLAEYSEATEMNYRKYYKQLEDRGEQVEQAYRKERNAIEDKIDDCFAQRKRLMLE